MNKKVVGLCGLLLAATFSLIPASAQYSPPSGGGGTGPTTNPVSVAQGGTGTATGVLTLSGGNFTLGDATHAGTVTYNSGTGFNSIIQTGPSILGNTNFNLPITNGAAGSLLIDQDSSGDTAWKAMSGDATIANTGAITLKNTGPGAGSFTSANITIDNQGRVTAAANGSGGGGSPGGSNSQVQYNSSGSFAANSKFTYDGTGVVGLGGGGNDSGLNLHTSDASDNGAITMFTVGAGPSCNITMNTDGTQQGAMFFDAAAGANPTIQMLGKTSGTCTVTPPSVAGTTKITLPSVNFTGATSQATATANVPIRDTSGTESFPAGLTAAANSFKVGVNSVSNGTLQVLSSNTGVVGSVTALANSTGAQLSVYGSTSTKGTIDLIGGNGASPNINLQGKTSGTLSITCANAAGSPNWVGPTQNVTEVTAQSTVAAPYVTSSNTTGARAYQTLHGAPSTQTTNFSAAAGLGYYNHTGSLTITLPTAVGVGGSSITYSADVTATTTINTTSSQTVGGSASGAKTFASTAAAPIFVQFVSDGVNWHYLAGS